MSEPATPPPIALVVFTDQCDVRWLRLLRPGFRHCFAVVRDPAGEWLACDWLKGRLVFRVYGRQRPEELVRRLTERGLRVAEVRVGERRRAGLVRPLSCVEVAKQAIGLGGLRPLTPYGLWRDLARRGARLHEN
jgi:hypothetical protein